MSESKTSVRRLQAVERQRQALELRMAGASYPSIARELGYASASGAMKAVTSAILRTLQEPADRVRHMEVARLDRLLLAIWPKALAGDDKAIRRVLDIMERRAKYLGLDAPTKIDITDEIRRAARDAGLSEEDAEMAVHEATRIVRESNQR